MKIKINLVAIILACSASNTIACQHYAENPTGTLAPWSAEVAKTICDEVKKTDPESVMVVAVYDIWMLDVHVSNGFYAAMKARPSDGKTFMLNMFRRFKQLTDGKAIVLNIYSAKGKIVADARSNKNGEVSVRLAIP